MTGEPRRWERAEHRLHRRHRSLARPTVTRANRRWQVKQRRFATTTRNRPYPVLKCSRRAKLRQRPFHTQSSTPGVTSSHPRVLSLAAGGHFRAAEEVPHQPHGKVRRAAHRTPSPPPPFPHPAQVPTGRSRSATPPPPAVPLFSLLLAPFGAAPPFSLHILAPRVYRALLEQGRRF